MKKPLMKVIMKKFGFTEKEAEASIVKALINAIQLIADEDSTYYICENNWGLEPDFINELLNNFYENIK